jgi:hypothetical protein
VALFTGAIGVSSRHGVIRVRSACRSEKSVSEEIEMPLVAIPGKIKLIGADTIIVMDAGTAHQAVHVTEDALSNSHGELSRDHLTAQLELIEQVASHKFDRGELAFDGSVWVTSEDILDWRRGRSH